MYMYRYIDKYSDTDTYWYACSMETKKSHCCCFLVVPSIMSSIRYREKGSEINDSSVRL